MLIFLKKNKCNFLHKNKLDIVRRVQFLTGRRPMRSISPGAVATIALQVGAYDRCNNFERMFDGCRRGRLQRDRVRRGVIVSQTARRTAVVRRQRLPLPPPVHLRRRALPVPARSAARPSARGRSKSAHQQRPRGHSRRCATGTLTNYVLWVSISVVAQSNLPKWILLQWIARLNGYHLYGPV